jgi:sigma-B regulation protein RsbU (phosphoserine phosphatase)
LSRTLIRTYALEFELQPDLVFFSTNERILQDARANLFVTAFYGILDVKTGRLTYCNAGHNPPFLIRAGDGGRVDALTANGMPIGVDMDAFWKQAEVQIDPGDVLLLYTDGIPDAQNTEGAYFKDIRMIGMAQDKMGTSAQEIQRSVLESIQEFAGEAPQFDDITLLVVMRESED